MSALITALESHINSKRQNLINGENNMPEVKYCIYGCGGSHRDSWKNDTGTKVACDSHDSGQFKKDAATLDKAKLNFMSELPKATETVEA